MGLRRVPLAEGLGVVGHSMKHREVVRVDAREEAHERHKIGEGGDPHGAVQHRRGPRQVEALAIAAADERLDRPQDQRRK